MPRRTTKKTAGTESPAEDSGGAAKKTRQSRGGNSRSRKNNTQETGMGAGTSQSFHLADPPIPESTVLQKLSLRQTLSKVVLQKHEWKPLLNNTFYTQPAYRTSNTETPPEEPELSRKCPYCSFLLKPVLDKAGHPTPRLQCLACPAGQLLCEQCLYPCSSTSTCNNKSCQLVSALLTCDRVTDPLSNVNGCPLFRACPKCHSLMMHESGCKYVTCMQCQHRYCFVCLQSTDECTKDKTKYWSLTCAVPRAARQRFQT